MKKKLYSGDVHLSLSQSIFYYKHALGESIRGTFDGAPCERASENPMKEFSEAGILEPMSPLRFWTEWSLKKEILKAFPTRVFRVLDLGCGSGRYQAFFQSTKVPCEYIGIDHKLHDSWKKPSIKDPLGLSVTLLEDDAEHLEKVTGQFDLWMSSTALEHFEDEGRMLQAISPFLRQNALGFHVVPAHHSWLIYFKHGYRRYSPYLLRDLFMKNGHEIVRCEGLGGPFGFLLHFFLKTFPERVLRCGPIKNQRLLDLYQRLLKRSVFLDWKLPPIFCVGYLVVVRYTGSSQNSRLSKEQAVTAVK